MDVSVIIVNYNVKEFVQNLLNSLEKASKNLAVEVIIVDNASDDGSVELIREKFPNVILVANKTNLGFGKANNIGLQMAKGKYLLILNPDTLVQEDTFEKLISFFERTPDAGMIGCKTLNPDGTLQLSCRRSFPGPWTSFCKVTGLSSIFPKSKIFAKYNLTYLDENKTCEVDALSGSFMLMKKEAYEKVGGFDEQFFMYGEDLDLCYRVQKAGYKVYYVPETQIIHYKGESTKRSSLDETKVFYGAMNLFVKKHFSRSLLLEIILQSAISFTKFLAFLATLKIVLFSFFLDFIVFDVTLYLAQKLHYVLGNWYGFPRKSLLIVYTVPALLYTLAASIIGVYKKDRISILKSLISIVAGFLLLSTLTFFFKQYAYSRAVIILAYVFLLFTLTAWRIIVKYALGLGIRGREAAKTVALIIGTNDSAVKIAQKLKSKSTSFYSVAGLISLTRKEIGDKIENFKIIGSVETLKKTITEKKVNEVIFSSDELSYSEIMSIVSSCQSENVEFKLAGSNLDFIVGKTSVSLLDDVPLIEINYNISKPLKRFIKAAFDYSLAGLVLFFILPFFKLFWLFGVNKGELGEMISKAPKILLGQYSFVGPKEVGNRKNLYLGKQGLTGLWFLEEENDSENLDIFYAKNQNLWLDIEILGRSINLMLSKRK